MESIGQRITRLRKLNGWSRPELGRKMAAAVKRAEPFTGEVVRLYELDTHSPGKDARKALAAVFDKPESYIVFGDQVPHKEEKSTATRVIDSRGATRELSPREEIVLELFAGLFSHQQRHLTIEMQALFLANQITRKELGQKPLRGISDARIGAIFGETPAPSRKAHPKKATRSKSTGRDPGAAMGDYLDD